MTLKDRTKNLLKIWLEEIEKIAEKKKGLEKIPDMKLEKYRTIAVVLQFYKAMVDEKAIEQELKRPKFSLEAVSGEDLRVAIVSSKREEEEKWKQLPSG